MGRPAAALPLEPFWQRSRAKVIALGAALLAVIGLADFATGYEVRLAPLYLLPIALLTWSAGLAAGIGASAVAAAIWLASFESSHAYSHPGYLYWEGAAMAAMFCVVVILVTRLHDALRRSDERFVLALETLPFPVCVADRAGGTPLWENRRHREASAERGASLEAAYRAAQAPGGAAEWRDPVSARWYIAEIAALPWADRSADLVAFTDITASKAADALRAAQTAAAERTERAMALGELAATIAHELNQPLAAVVSYSETCRALLRQPGVAPAALDEALGKCSAQGLRAGEILRRLRELVRRRSPVHQVVRLPEIARAAEELLERELAERDARLAVVMPRGLPVVRGDPLMLEQVLVNLVRNALHALDAGATDRTLEIAGRTVRDGVEVAVLDRGRGVPVGMDVFAPFQSTRPGGLGLGLAICRSIVEAHGGQIAHAERPGGGAAFVVTLPAAEGA